MTTISVNYNGSVTTDVKTHLKLMRLFGRQPTASEFREIFRVDPFSTLTIRPWIKELILDDCLDGLGRLDNECLKNVIATMMKNHATAEGIITYIDKIVEKEGNTPWSKKARVYFEAAEAEDELIDAIASFHDDGVIANGIRLQSVYDDYVHRVNQQRIREVAQVSQLHEELPQTLTE